MFDIIQRVPIPIRKLNKKIKDRSKEQFLMFCCTSQ